MVEDESDFQQFCKGEDIFKPSLYNSLTSEGYINIKNTALNSFEYSMN